MKKFLGRTFNEKTMTWSFSDGSGTITHEGRFNILNKSYNPSTGKYNLFRALIEKDEQIKKLTSNHKDKYMEWEKEFERRFIGYEKVSGGIGLSYVTDVDNPYLKNDISGIKDFIRQALESQMSDLRKEVKKMKKEDLPVGLGHNLYGYNQALDEVLLLMKK